MKKIKFIEKLITEGKVKLVLFSDDICESYIVKSKNSFKAARLLFEQNLFEESISMSYYSMFHILIGLLYKIGIKCENHNAAIILLKELFGLDNSKISYAKKERIDKQYYIDFNITKDDAKELIEFAEDFISELYNYIDNLKKQDIDDLHNKFKEAYFENE